MKFHQFFQVLSLVLLVLILVPVVTSGLDSAADGTETLLSADILPVINRYPAIYGDRVVWENHDRGRSNLVLYNITTGEETWVTNDTISHTLPALYDDTIVCQELVGGHQNIVMYSLSGSSYLQRTQVTTSETWDRLLPAVSHDYIVWEDYRNSSSNPDLYLYFRANSTTAPLVIDPFSQRHPSVYGDRVAWEDWRNDDPAFPGSNSDIYLMNLTTGVTIQVTTDPCRQQKPALSGNRIVWEDDRSVTMDFDIWMWDGTAESQVTSDSHDQLSPKIDGNRIFWYDKRNDPRADIYMTDLSAPAEKRITTPASVLVQPLDDIPSAFSLSQSRVVWTDQRQGGTHDVYLFTSTPGSSRTCPTADFTETPRSGSPGVQVRFTDASAAPPDNAITSYLWNFGDGGTSILPDPAHTFQTAGKYPVSLQVSNSLCRNITPAADRYNVSVGPAAAGFTATPDAGPVPLTVTFTDTSQGLSITTWNWSFGDGKYSDLPSPSHTYAARGTYQVQLMVNNSYGGSTATTTIRALGSANRTANATIPGIQITDSGEKQHISFDTGQLSAWTFGTNHSVLEFTPPADRGFGNLTLYAVDGIGFRHDPVTGEILGNITGFRLQSEEIVPDDFDPALGKQSSVNYTMDMSRYPVQGRVNVLLWDAVLQDDSNKLTSTAIKAGYDGVEQTGYTMKITTINVPAPGNVEIFMNVNSSWASQKTDGRQRVFFGRITEDGRTGEILTATFRGSNSEKQRDYFSAPSPHGTSTFILSQLSGTGNPFQLITLSILGQLNPGSYLSGSTDSAGPSSVSSPAGQGRSASSVPSAEMKAPPAPDPGRSEKVFTGRDGVTTQPLALVSTDRLVSISLDKGVTARDSVGNPLGSLSVTSVPSESVAASTGGELFSFAGMAYEVQPDGATFSPALTISFTLPQAAWGQNYAIQRYDRATGRWQEIPSVYDASTGQITAQTDHLCTFAVFTKTAPAVKTGTPTPVVTSPALKAPPAEPPSTAVSIFMSLLSRAISIVENNIVIVLIIGAAVGIGYYWVRVR